MEPTPIFAAMADVDHERAAGAQAAGAHTAGTEASRRARHAGGGEGRSVTDLLRSLRDDHAAVAPGPPAVGGRRVGHVPDLLTFP
ncbi:hypothetical protein Acsp06_04890 [Actinomycetospora sp. NBRC 106375]|uniref:hypothetical protein n=1 Tax=Actinomycetospora sp. NBRC 106375 TaxID=3032207 RepID=UPI0024A08FA7|nr:hypothetical protein [Actinomycetospora sp. NBRC 106375]GLZ44304.1 hypothetical protein Acsp06_04890 [Actinomycetospora sp. NBRC 106375]